MSKLSSEVPSMRLLVALALTAAPLLAHAKPNRLAEELAPRAGIGKWVDKIVGRSVNMERPQPDGSLIRTQGSYKSMGGAMRLTRVSSRKWNDGRIVRKVTHDRLPVESRLTVDQATAFFAQHGNGADLAGADRISTRVRLANGGWQCDVRYRLKDGEIRQQYELQRINDGDESNVAKFGVQLTTTH